MEWLVASDLDIEECSALLALLSSQTLAVEADETFITYAQTAESIHARGPRSWLRSQQQHRHHRRRLSGSLATPATAGGGGVAVGNAARLLLERRRQKQQQQQQQQQSGEQPTLPNPPPCKKLWNLPAFGRGSRGAYRKVKHNMRRLQDIRKAGRATEELRQLDPYCLGLSPVEASPQGGATLYAKRMMLPSTPDT